MKRYLLGFAVFVLLSGVAGCKTETTDSPDNGEDLLTFRTVLGKQTATRATEFNNTSWVNGNQLSVYAYLPNSTTPAYTAHNPFVLNYDGTAWSYADPETSHGILVHYYSWYPSDYVTGNTPAATSYSFGYTVPADYTAQKDLIAVGVSTSLAAVPLEFKHTLSQINFGLVQTFGLTIQVTNIRLTGVLNSGTYTINGSAPGWAVASSTQTYPYLPATGTNITDGTAGPPKDMKNATNALMLLPQSFGASSAAAIVFDYALSYNTSGTVTTKTGTGVTSLLRDFNITSWEEGKRYLYQFDFSSFLTTGEITFNVRIDPWVDASTIAQTLQVADATLEHLVQAIDEHSAANSTTTTLKVFPINVPGTVSADMTLTTIEGFDAGDQIRVEFVDAASAAHLKSSVPTTNWTLAVSGRIATLTCVAPM